MTVLVLGGAGFIGSAVIEAARASGHEVVATVRTSGRRPTRERQTFAEYVECDYASTPQLELDSFAIVIDTIADRPWMQRPLLERLQTAPGHYVFISSTAVYADYRHPRDERSPLKPPVWSDVPFSPMSYGGWKVACEEQIASLVPDALILRPGIVVGSGAGAAGIEKWQRLMKKGGALGPGSSASPIQLVDVRDLAAWTVSAAEAKLAATLNVVPSARQTWGDLVEAVSAAALLDAEVVWKSDDELLTMGLQPFEDLPFWIPADGDTRCFYEVVGSRAVENGWTSRRLAETVEWILRGR